MIGKTIQIIKGEASFTNKDNLVEEWRTKVLLSSLDTDVICKHFTETTNMGIVNLQFGGEL